MQVDDRVKEIIAGQLGIKIEKVIDSASFVDDLGADSLDAVETTMYFEEEFGFQIPDEDVEDLTTVEDIVDYIQKRVDEKDKKFYKG